MRVGTMCLHGQHGIQQQHSLSCPGFEAAVVRYGTAKVIVQFLIYINQ